MVAALASGASPGAHRGDSSLQVCGGGDWGGWWLGGAAHWGGGRRGGCREGAQGEEGLVLCGGVQEGSTLQVGVGWGR